MANDKAKNIEMITRKINKNKELLKNWKKFGISDRKISKLEDKIARDEIRKAELEAS